MLKIIAIINKTVIKTRGFMGVKVVFDGTLEEIKAQKDRLFLWMPVAFGLGITAYFTWPFEAGLAWTAFFMLLLFFVMIKLYKKHHDNLFWFLSYLFGFFMILVFGGFLTAQIGTLRVGTPILEKSLKFANVQGDVEHVEPLNGKRGSRVLLSNLNIDELEKDDTPKKVRITFRKDDGIKAGQRIKTLANLSPPSRAVLPNAYNFRRHLFFEGIGAVGYSYKPATVLKDNQNNVFFENMRTHINQTIGAQSGAVTAGIMTALITGARGEIAAEDNDAMRDSGLYHLLSISGSHVSMVAGVLFFFSRFFMAAIPWLALRYPIKKIAAFIALLGSAFYVVLAGAEVPAQRSLIMTAFVMITIMLDRSPFSLRSIAFAALVVLVIAPFALVGVSFQMSFSAVAGLICFFEYIKPWWMSWYSRGGFFRKSFMYLCAIGMTSIIAGGMTGLFSLYHFQSFAVYGVLSNMLAVPLTGFVVMPAAVVAMILMPFGLADWPLYIMEWGVLKMLIIAHWTAGFDGAVIHVHQWSVLTFIFLCAGALILLIWKGWRGKGLAIFLILLGMVTGTYAKKPNVVVSETGKLIGVHDNQKLYVSSNRKEKFTSENWSRLMGFDDVRPLSFYSDKSPIKCDDYACRWQHKGKNFSFVKGRHALEDECAWANVVIADIPVRNICKNFAARTFDLYDFKYKGAHAFYIHQNGVMVKNTGQSTKNRPWD